MLFGKNVYVYRLCSWIVQFILFLSFKIFFMELEEFFCVGFFILKVSGFGMKYFGFFNCFVCLINVVILDFEDFVLYNLMLQELFN